MQVQDAPIRGFRVFGVIFHVCNHHKEAGQ